MEARDLRNMTIAQTPLLGEENTPIHVAEMVLALRVPLLDIKSHLLPIPL